MAEYDALIGAIYDCATDPENWPAALGMMRDTVQSAYALVGCVDRSQLATGAPPVMIRRHSGWDEAWLDRLDTMLAKIPQGEKLFYGDVDKAWTQMQQTPEEEFHKTIFYQKWVKPQGLRDTLNISYLKHENVTGVLALPSYQSRELFSDKECKLVESLSPHIRRAMVINDLTDTGRTAQVLYRDVLDCMSVAVFVVGLGRRIIFSNQAAEAMLSQRDFLTLAGGSLHSQRSLSQSSCLEDAVDRALKGDHTVGTTGIGVPLLGADGTRAAAYVLPLDGKGARGAFGAGHCAVFVATREDCQPMATDIMRAMFDLTTMEARVVLLLARGDGPQEIADTLDISVNTVRTHLKHAYAKTDTRDQTDLSGLVNALLPPLKNRVLHRKEYIAPSMALEYLNAG